MKKIFYCLFFIILSSTLILCGKKEEKPKSGEQEPIRGKALITGSSVRVRSEPSLEGKEVVQLALGTEVEITGESEKEMKIDAMSAKWFKIKAGDKEGWTYGGFMVKDYQKSPDGAIKLWYGWESNSQSPKTIHFVNSGNNHYGQITLPEFAQGYTLSKSSKYLLLDSGTDVIRGLSVFSLADGKSLVSAMSAGNSGWKGDTVIFQKVREMLSGCVLWDEMIFSDGKVTKSGKTGRSGYHLTGSDVDARCK